MNTDKIITIGMDSLDETDRDILQLLAHNSQRTYSAIADEIGVSAPTVSNRIERLQETGIIRRFTIDIDRSKLQTGVSVLVEITVESGCLDRARDQLRESSTVEHLFTTAERTIIAVTHIDAQNIHEWLTNTVHEDVIDDYTITLLPEVEWTPTIDGPVFARSCAECGNTVSDDGVMATIDGRTHYFCCVSCRDTATDRSPRPERPVTE